MAGAGRRQQPLLRRVVLGAAAGWAALVGVGGRLYVPTPGSAPQEAPSRRSGLLGLSAALSAAAALEGGLDPVLAEEPQMDPKMPEVELPERITSDPYQLLGVNPDSKKEDRAEFYMKRAYRDDTYQVLKHMKISGSLDKGTPNMERFNNRVKEEMDDWMSLYRRQDGVVGRQSFYALRSSVNALASHFTSYGPKFPFPNKRRPRFYQKINLCEKYLEKGK
eukprot:TRINITY_DN13518_c0_g1_i1.p1 TRINITY_DN13518_c0_g1~~TRINITY_DN13518_c0_g1_i1.p1  ORF type:complete len:221 (-),score=65.38 TRINITY_DN13518_c0_g1_i1:226-888(-)